MKLSRITSLAPLALILSGLAAPVAADPKECKQSGRFACQSSDNGNNENDNSNTNDGDSNVDNNNNDSESVLRSGATLSAVEIAGRMRICDSLWHTSVPFDILEASIWDQVRSLLAANPGNGVYVAVQDQVITGVANGLVAQHIAVAVPDDQFVCVYSGA